MSKPIAVNKRNAIVILILVCATKIALYLGLHYVGVVEPFVGDNAKDHYLPIAQRLVQTGSFNGPDSRPDSKVPPGYPITVAALQLVSSSNAALGTVVVQFISDLLTSFGLLFLGARFLRMRIGLLAGLSWQLFPPAVMISTWITAETVFTLFLVAATVFLILALDTRSTQIGFVAGVILGISIMYRGTCLYFPVFLLGCLPMLRRRWAYLLVTLAFVAGTICVVIPWKLRNTFVLDDDITVAVGVGSVFLQGSNEKLFTIEGKRKHYPSIFDAATREGIVKPTSGKESHIDHWLFRIGLRNLKKEFSGHPERVPWFYFRKFLRLWYATESGAGRGQVLVGILSLLVLVPSVIQILEWKKTCWVLHFVIICLSLYFILLHTLTLPLFRYMLPVFPLLLLAWSAKLTESIQSLQAWSEEKPTNEPTPIS